MLAMAISLWPLSISTISQIYCHHLPTTWWNSGSAIRLILSLGLVLKPTACAVSVRICSFALNAHCSSSFARFVSLSASLSLRSSNVWNSLPPVASHCWKCYTYAFYSTQCVCEHYHPSTLAPPIYSLVYTYIHMAESEWNRLTERERERLKRESEM